MKQPKKTIIKRTRTGFSISFSKQDGEACAQAIKAGGGLPEMVASIGQPDKVKEAQK